MKLSALIQGKRTARSLRPATANLAKVAKDDTNMGDILPRLAGLATLALAPAGKSEILDDSPFLNSEPIKAAPLAPPAPPAHSASPAPPAHSAHCYSCHGSDFWNSASTGDLICRKCHPPADPKLERIEAAFPTVATEEELMEMIRNTYAELDSLRDWTGWRKSLTGEQQRHLVGIETRIDATYAAFDRKALTMALSDYRAARYQGNPLRHITLGGKLI